jgi:hypothetical protein
MRFFDILDVREREGKQPAFEKIGTLYFNDNGKMSVYLPMTGRFYPVKEQKPRQQAAPQSDPGAYAPPPQMPGQAPPLSPDHLPPLGDDDVPF